VIAIGEPLPRRRQRLAFLLRDGFRQAMRHRGALNVKKYGFMASSLEMYRFARAIDERGPFDVAHAHFGQAALVPARLHECGSLRIPLIVTFHGYDVNVIPRTNPDGIYKYVFAAATYLVVGSQFMADCLIQLGAPPDKILVCPIGVDSPECTDNPTTDTFSLVSVGRLVECKGHHVTLKALAIAANADSKADFRLSIVGDGDERDKLMKYAEELGLTSRVQWLGARLPHEVRGVLRQSHAMVHAAIRSTDGSEEGQGLVVLEAQSEGVPVVATNIGGLPENLIDGVTGYLVPESDPQAIADKILRLASDPNVRSAMGTEGRKFVAEHRSWSGYMENVLDLYRAAIARDGKG